MARVGLDIAPIDTADADAIRWLEACIWPDVPGRIERFRAASALLRTQPPRLLRGDMVEDLEGTVRATLGDLGPTEGRGVHLVVCSSWALTYVERARRGEVAKVLARSARAVPAVSWVTAEPPGCVPGLPLPEGLPLDDDITVLGARRWRGRRELAAEAWGTCHPHGEWLALSGP